jgi:hypothetical protein
MSNLRKSARANEAATKIREIGALPGDASAFTREVTR